MANPPAPPHHDPAGGFRNPWPQPKRGFADFLRWRFARLGSRQPSRAVDRSTLRVVASAFDSPFAEPGECTVTWVGHSSFLLQLGRVNVLTDPVWSVRAAPVRGLGPRRLVPAAVPFESLPPIDLVLISHNHYDHLDDQTVRGIAARAPGAWWVSPLGVGDFLRRRGIMRVAELDWWEETEPLLDSGRRARIACTPAAHFSARGLRDRDRTLWCSFVIAAEGRTVFFCGDSGHHPAFPAIGERYGPFDLVLLPIGAYDPRWFMRPVHMDPEEAVRAYLELTVGAERLPPMVGMHWGTFVLTDEPVDEPPRRTRAAWSAAALDEHALWILQHGETRRLPGAHRPTSRSRPA